MAGKRKVCVLRVVSHVGKMRCMSICRDSAGRELSRKRVRNCGTKKKRHK